MSVNVVNFAPKPKKRGPVPIPVGELLQWCDGMTRTERLRLSAKLHLIAQAIANYDELDP